MQPVCLSVCGEITRFPGISRGAFGTPLLLLLLLLLLLWPLMLLLLLLLLLLLDVRGIPCVSWEVLARSA